MPTDLARRPRLSEARAHLSEARSWLSDHRAATTVVGALAAASLLLWGGLVIAAGDAPTGASTSGQQAGAPAPAGGEGEPGDEVTEDEVTEDEATADEATADEAPRPDQTPEADLPAEADLTPELVAQPEPLEPDDHAPLDAADADERWIVVLASYTRSSAAERDLRSRASDEDAQMLWSSHYAGLTPDLWVVFTGPFPGREAALDAAERLGGDAYARDLAARPGG